MPLSTSPPARPGARRRGAALAAAAVTALCLSAAGTGAAAPVAASGITVTPAYGESVPGELIVRFRPGTTTAERAQAVSAEGGRVLQGLGTPGVNLLRVAPGDAAEAAASLADRDAVLWVEPNRTGRYDAVPNDALFARQWALNNTGQPVTDSDGPDQREVAGVADADIDAAEAWDRTTGSPGVVVAIADSGVAHDHPDLAPNIWHNPGESGGGREANGIDDDGNGFVDDIIGWDFAQNDNDPRDVVGHGTGVAGVVGARGGNGAGVTGINHQVQLMPLVSGGDVPDTAALAAAFTYAARNGAKVVNASLTVPPSQAVSDAIAAAPNVLFVVASGNQGQDVEGATAFFPCTVPTDNLICVASTDSKDALAPSSNRGVRSVDLGAPGVNIWTTAVSRSQPFFDGFSAGDPFAWSTNGAWARNLAGDGSTVVSDSPGRNYFNNSDTAWATNVGFSTRGQFGCKLKTTMFLDVPAPDVVAVEAAAAGTPFRRLSVLSGRSTGFEEVTTALTGLDNTDQVFLRYRLISDGAVTGDGAALKFVIVNCASTTYRGSEYSAVSGTSFASPLTAGTAALAWAAAPTATAAQIRAALLGGVDPIPALAGVTVTGGRLNAARAVANAAAAVQPVAKAAPTARPRVRLLAARLGANRRVSLRMTCPKTVARGCRGSLAVATVAQKARKGKKAIRSKVLARTRFSVAAGRTRWVGVKLSKASLATLRARGRRVVVVVNTRAADGTPIVVRSRIRVGGAK